MEDFLVRPEAHKRVQMSNATWSQLTADGLSETWKTIICCHIMRLRKVRERWDTWVQVTHVTCWQSLKTARDITENYIHLTLHYYLSIHLTTVRQHNETLQHCQTKCEIITAHLNCPQQAQVCAVCLQARCFCHNMGNQETNSDRGSHFDRSN